MPVTLGGHSLLASRGAELLDKVTKAVPTLGILPNGRSLSQPQTLICWGDVHVISVATVVCLQGCSGVLSKVDEARQPTEMASVSKMVHLETKIGS